MSSSPRSSISSACDSTSSFRSVPDWMSAGLSEGCIESLSGSSGCLSRSYSFDLASDGRPVPPLRSAAMVSEMLELNSNPWESAVIAGRGTGGGIEGAECYHRQSEGSYGGPGANQWANADADIEEWECIPSGGYLPTVREQPFGSRHLVSVLANQILRSTHGFQCTKSHPSTTTLFSRPCCASTSFDHRCAGNRISCNPGHDRREQTPRVSNSISAQTFRAALYPHRKPIASESLSALSG
ncbi:hypothetical protein P152DRAFT_510251 [Eremomyces bilateralis CBS 781.70]|uniref:Uncharacterized protein n=1 Tax=Eremomyces bilateralis CBS 781.70 TaxID=1392243 RepID=A0A6G1GFZ8_9PEZI|nr:uncharacterized protein P152DRAFT_510251 [Eremomyces bilateralis CBS 781.70]KAF1816912.1 hypothetical protein P152DRAFT_510251 [Eremomyces bilateralis CBS 781.70]